MIEGRQVFVPLIRTVASAAGVPLKNIVINMVHRLETGNAHNLKKNLVYDLQYTGNLLCGCLLFLLYRTCNKLLSVIYLALRLYLIFIIITWSYDSSESQCTGMWRHVVWWRGPSVSVQRAVAIFCPEHGGSRFFLKRWWLHIRPHGVTVQGAEFINF
jgi:hypothetical protein